MGPTVGSRLRPCRCPLPLEMAPESKQQWRPRRPEQSAPIRGAPRCLALRPRLNGCAVTERARMMAMMMTTMMKKVMMIPMMMMKMMMMMKGGPA
eukprot:5569989-Pyramimonas_sp.AAC.1